MRSLILVHTDALEEHIAKLAEAAPGFSFYCAAIAGLLIVSGILMFAIRWPFIGYLLVLLPFLLYTLIFRALVPARAMQRLVRRAMRDELDAILEMGRVYEFGNSEIPKEQETARSWYRRAAQRGHVGAAYRLAELLRQERTNEDLKREALTWYHFAAEHGYLEAAAWLAWAYEIGDGVQASNSLAEKFKKMAESLGKRAKIPNENSD